MLHITVTLRGMTLPIQTHLTSRNGTYYFRRRIPLELLPHYAPKLEITFSLKTKDLKEAERLSRVESVRLDDEFERFKNNLTATPIDSISREIIKKLTDAWKAQVLEEDEETRILGLSDRDYRKIDESLGIVEAGGKAAFAKGDTSLIEFEMVDFCEPHGLNLVEGSEAYTQLAYAFLRASVDVNNQLILRHQGEIIDTPEAPVINPLITQPINSMDSLESLMKYWLTQSVKSRTAEAEAINIIKKFKTMVGDIKPSEVTRKHVAELKDKMLEAKSAPATINKSRGILAAIFSTAEKNGKINKNPFNGMVKLKVPEKEEDSPYTIQELQIIFNAPVFTQGYRPNRFKGEASYWLPLLGLYTAGRINELGQLYVEDIQVEDDIHYIIIKPDSATKRTVKDNKKRRVPLHPDLIKMGFLEYLAKIKSEGHIQLFPELKVTRDDGKLADKFGAWWSSYVRKELHIARIPQPFHAFRHTFSEHGKRTMTNHEARYKLEGHAINTVGDKYGNKLYPLGTLNDEIKKLNFKGLDMTHLFKT